MKSGRRVLLLPLLGALLAASSLSAQDPTPPRTLDQLKKTIREINTSGERPSETGAAERDAALRRLKVYRYLAGVPYENLVLDDEFNKLARAGARLCEKLGRLDHKPENPGLSADEYQLGLKGTGGSNLAEGYPTLAKAVDAWMDDSSDSNIDRLGHRRWCLFPYLQKVGFGRAGKFSAMYILDRSQPEVPDFDYVAFPAAGLMPVEYFNPTWAWNVSLNPRKYRAPANESKPVVQEVNNEGKKLGTPLTLNHTSVNNEGFGLPGCIIFRPEGVVVRPGKRYRVEIDGLMTTRGAKAKPLAYTVEFVGVR
jgi:hypothetical protein